jgi:DNA-binding GntR family transcriptional regulator
MILTGVLEMGSRLNEVDLPEAFGISRPPLREAIRSLADQGLLEIVNHKGAYVPSYTAKDLCEIYEVRMALESHSAPLLATRCTANDLGQIERILDSAEHPISRGESSAYQLMTQHLRRSLANALRVSVIEGAPNSGATPVRDDERPGRTTT